MPTPLPPRTPIIRPVFCRRATCVYLSRGCDCQTHLANHQRARFNGVTCQADPPFGDCTFPRCSCGDIRDPLEGRDYIGIIIAALTIMTIFCVMLYAYSQGYMPRAH